MKKRIFIIRTTPYDYLIPGMNLYQSFNAVAKRKVEISVKPEAKEYFRKNLPIEILNTNSVYCSPRKRSIQTANFILSDPRVLEELIEVKFEMEDFITEKGFYDKQGNANVQKARKAFVKALVNNKLGESYKEVIQRIESLLKMISQDRSNKILVFSHGFFMKIIEAYVKDSSVKNRSKNLLKYFDGSSETFKFCGGFILEFENGEFEFNSYIKNIGDK
ncbi:MAG: histidine phosphatase family protein [bacterium]|nr:histidine phosphatase family protein [bacterium]